MTLLYIYDFQEVSRIKKFLLFILLLVNNYYVQIIRRVLRPAFHTSKAHYKNVPA